jgi:hypothetical protein
MCGLAPFVTLLRASVSPTDGKRTLKCDGFTQCDSAAPAVKGGMIRMSRNVSILSVMVMMTAMVMATVTVAFATPNEGSNGQPKVEICHKGQIITVAQPAVAAHERHGDTLGPCGDGQPPEGATPVLTTVATTQVTLGDLISDTATLAGATSDATGTITFTLYGPYDASVDPATELTDPCAAGDLVFTSDPIDIGTADTEGNYVVESPEFEPTEVGRYQWIASYSGDDKNEPSTTLCRDADEASVVN